MYDYSSLELSSPLDGMARYFSSPDFLTTESWSGLVYAVGYERRSDHAASQMHDRCESFLGIGFQSNQVLSYDRNLSAARQRGAVEVCPTAEVGAVVSRFVRANIGSPERRLAIDVSSFSRDRLALILWSVLNGTAESGYADVDLLYSPAAFRRANRSSDPSPVRASLLAQFEGWISDPSLPTRAIVGLGYEPGRAVGAIEFLEPALIDFFMPVGFDARYEDEVRAANEGLLASSDAVSVFSYRLAEPFTLMAQLMALVDDRSSHRPVLLPLGPKIFAAAAIVASALAAERVPVWRISDGGVAPTKPTVAEGPVVVLRMQFRAVEANPGGRSVADTPADSVTRTSILGDL